MFHGDNKWEHQLFVAEPKSGLDNQLAKIESKYRVEHARNAFSVTQ